MPMKAELFDGRLLGKVQEGGHDFGTGIDLHFSHQVLEMIFDGLFADKQEVADFLVGLPSANELDHFKFPFGQFENGGGPG